MAADLEERPVEAVGVGRGGGQRAIGIVMVMSDAPKVATALRDVGATTFKGIVRID